jgi:signal transduction histidine kinase
MFRLHRLRWQLLASYLPLIAMPVLLVNLVTSSVTAQRVDDILLENTQVQSQLFTECLAGFYEQRGSWDGLSVIVRPMMMGEAPMLFDPAMVEAVQPDALRFEVQVLGDPIMAVNANCWQYLGQRFDKWRAFREAQASGRANGQRGRPAWIMPHHATPGNALPGALPGTLPDAGPSTPPLTPVAPGWAGDAAAADGVLQLATPGQPAMPPMEIISFDQLPQGLIVVGSTGQVVASSSDLIGVGATVEEGVLSRGVPVKVGDRRVGTIFFSAALDAQRQTLLDSVRGSLVLAGLVSFGLAAVLGWELSRRITAPVRELMSGVRRLQTGAWSKPLHIHANNEIGELTHAFNGMATQITRQHQMNRQMVADIAHDLRTPLSALALEVDAIEAGYQSPTEAVASLREEIAWLQRMVEDLRLLSLIDAEQIRLQRTPTPPQEFLCGVLDFWESIASEVGRRLIIDMSPDLPTSVPVILIDPARMRQVLANLIDNAIRHTQPGGTITLGARAEAAKDGSRGTHLAIWVKDDGMGISPDDLPRIFDRFYRSDPSRAHHQTGGSGLGLSIARRLVEMHSGSIEVSSQPGRGATFTIRLPVSHASGG